MLASGDARDSNGIPGYEASRDYIGTDVHGMGITHLDALCHMFVRGEMYNGRPAGDVRATVRLSNTVMATADGLVGRGVLLDIPRRAGRRRRSTATRAITVGRPRARPRRRRASPVRAGDILIVAGGRDARRAAQGGRSTRSATAWPGCTRSACPGCTSARWRVLVQRRHLRPDAGPRHRRLAVPGAPDRHHRHGPASRRQRGPGPARRRRAPSSGRWEFLFTVAPLRIPGGTGCPVNPIAVFYGYQSWAARSSVASGSSVAMSSSSSPGSRLS